MNVFYCRYTDPIPDDRIAEEMKLWPVDHLHKNRRFRRAEDRTSHYLGKRLLLHGLEVLGLGHYSLEDLQYTEGGRPFFRGTIDFNISHTDGLVVCAIAQTGRVGIDVERHLAVDFDNLKSTMNGEQWKMIHSASNKEAQFYQFWTMKEAVLKADGTGIVHPLNELSERNGTVKMGDDLWFVHPLDLDASFSCTACSNQNNQSIEVIEIESSHCFSQV